MIRILGCSRDILYFADIVTAETQAPAFAVCRERIVSIDRQADPSACVLANRTIVRVSGALAAHIGIGDEVAFAIGAGNEISGEVYITKSGVSFRQCDLYQALIRYVTQPRLDKRGQHFVSAEVGESGLGISAIFLPCEALRNYFYRLRAAAGQNHRPTFYEALRIPPSATLAELRLAYRLHTLEVNAELRRERFPIEQAFNILAQPELRACYDALLANPESPVIFPYGGPGSLLVSGERSRDGQTFFANRILAFSPEQKHRRFQLSLRQCDFYEDRVLCRDARRKLEFWLDPALLHVHWDPTWNQWKHFLPAKVEVNGIFIQCNKLSTCSGRWELVGREIGLPSSLQVQTAGNFEQQLEAAKLTYRRFGQYSRALDQIRLCLEHHALEKQELERMCSKLRIPADLGVAQINWRPDYDLFFYDQLSRRARRIYLFRGEYIFDLEKAVVVETPQLGHATYVFAKPRNMEGFLTVYTKITKEDIRRNRDNVGERLGFVGRIVHGSNQWTWLKEMRRRLEEKIDFGVR